MSAVAATFHLFPSLPTEIRLEIYILATPPRFVHVREGLVVHYRDFLKRFNEYSFSLQLHPALAHFARNWRYCLIPQDDRPEGLQKALCFKHTYHRPPQSTLEQHGFTSSKPAVQPWTATEYTPALSLSWLLTQPKLAWNFLRKSYLYSRAPIPPLLHTCAESRDALVRHGYRLAFGTRTHGPRTWFHFERDTLHLKPCDWAYNDADYALNGGDYDDSVHGNMVYESWLMCRSGHNVGQFLPEDLLRVRNLSLSGLGLGPLNEEYLCNLLRMFGYGISVLCIVQRILEEDIDVDELAKLKACPGRSTELPNEIAPMDYTPLAQQLLESEREFRKSTSWDPWDCVDCDPLDVTLCEPGAGVPRIFREINRNTHLSRIAIYGPSFLKSANGGAEKDAYFPGQCRMWGNSLAELLGVVQTEYGRKTDDSDPRPRLIPGILDDGPDAPSPKVPLVIRYVHLGTGVPMLYLDFERKARAVKLGEYDRLGVAWDDSRG